MNEDMAHKIGYIDDRFPFDLTKSLDWNIKKAIDILIETGLTEEEAEEIVNTHKSKYFNADGTRKDGKDK